MARYTGRRLALLGLVTALGGVVGCEDRQDATVREQAREAGREARELGREAEIKAREARDNAREAVEGFREGWGGAGDPATTPPAPPPPAPERDPDETR